jgi:hypothetical protein
MIQLEVTTNAAREIPIDRRSHGYQARALGAVPVRSHGTNGAPPGLCTAPSKCMSCPIRDVLYVFTCFYVTLQKTKVKQSLSIYCEFQHAKLDPTRVHPAAAPLRPSKVFASSHYASFRTWPPGAPLLGPGDFDPILCSDESLRRLSPLPCKAAAPKGPAFCFLNY